MSEPKRIPPRLAHRVAAILLAVVLVGVAARISVPIPGSPVPQSLQTLAVLLVGFFLGGRDGTLAIAAYLLVGAAGAPVFADGAAGWTHLVGPTAGYLIGFAVAGGGVGWLAARGHLNRFAPAFGAMVLGHAAILLLGWLRLGGTLGYASAFEQGVAPFVGGGAVKSAVGAAMAVGAGRLGWSYLLLSLLAPPQAITAQEAPLITFDHYHTLAEIETYLGEVAARYPELVTLHEIGRSRVGRPIWAVDVNNPATGPAAEKPGFYVDGNIHGGEVLGGEGALAFLERLTSRYGTEQEITELVDSRAFYVVPIVNPDGRAISVDTPANHRWNIRPVDEDGDGLMDEDPPEDLDGDGRMLQMRLLDPEGSWSIHPTDPRRMVRGDAAARPRYRMEREGIDNDGDGRFNEDRVGGVDLNRDFPANWSAAQFASGPSRSPNPRPTRSSPTSPRGRTSRPSTRSTPAAASFSVSRPWRIRTSSFQGRTLRSTGE